jgi:hypothetical protein
MATTQWMIQFDVVQYLDSHVTEVSGLDEQAVIFLDPSKKSILRELTAEEVGGVLVSKAPGMAPLGLDDPWVELSLVFPGRDNREYFYGPSHVPSPEVKAGALGAILRVMEVGVSTASPGQLSVARRIGAHAYIDQVD